MKDVSVTHNATGNAPRRGFRPQILAKSALLIISALPAAVQATTYTGTVGAIFVPDTTVSTSAPASYSISSRGATASVSLSDANHGTINARADSGSSGGSDSSGQIAYSFQVVGASDIFVPVRVQAHGSAEGHGGKYFAQSNFSLSYYSLASYPYYVDTLSARVTAYDQSTTAGAPVSYDSFDLDQTVMMRSNYQAAVNLSAGAVANAYFGSAFAAGFVDPTFTIDPAYASRFTITGLPGPATPASGVPEPASWAMMVLGFGIVGSTMRRRHNRLSPLVAI